MFWNNHINSHQRQYFKSNQLLSLAYYICIFFFVCFTTTMASSLIYFLFCEKNIFTKQHSFILKKFKRWLSAIILFPVPGSLFHLQRSTQKPYSFEEVFFLTSEETLLKETMMTHKHLNHTILPLYCASWGINPMFDKVPLLLAFLWGGVVPCCSLCISQVMQLPPRAWYNVGFLWFWVFDLYLM